MITKLVIMFFGIILAFIVWTVCLMRLYHREQLRANILQEQLDIKRQIERGNRADKIVWKYHNVAYLNNTYNIRVKNLRQR